MKYTDSVWCLKSICGLLWSMAFDGLLSRLLKRDTQPENVTRAKRVKTQTSRKTVANGPGLPPRQIHRRRRSEASDGTKGFESIPQHMYEVWPPRGAPPRYGTRELEAVTDHLPWPCAIAELISRSCARVPWTLHRTRGNGPTRRELVRELELQTKHADRLAAVKDMAKRQHLAVVKRHPLLDFLYAGNGLMSGYKVRQLWFKFDLLIGEDPTICASNLPSQLPNVPLPVPASWIAELPTPRKRSFTFCYGSWHYEVPEESVLYRYKPSPMMPYGRGTSAFRALIDEMQTDEYAAKHLLNWFFHDAQNTVLITGPGIRPNDPETKRAIRDWGRPAPSGHRTPWSPYLLGGEKVGVHQLSSTFQEMQLGQVRDRQRDTSLAANFVPPELLGIRNSTTKAQANVARSHFQANAVAPLLCELHEDFMCHMVDRYPGHAGNVWLEYESPIDRDEELRDQQHRTGPQVGEVNKWQRYYGDEEDPEAAGIVVAKKGYHFFGSWKEAVEHTRRELGNPSLEDDSPKEDMEPAKPEGVPANV